jgi:hypothetical protein
MMMLLMSILWVGRLFGNAKRRKNLYQLQQQHYLHKYGIETTAEIMESFLLDERIGNYLPTRLWLKLRRPDGILIYTHSNILVNIRQRLVKGQTVKIKYLPGNLSSILII